MNDISLLRILRESGSIPCPHCTKPVILTIESQKPRIVAFVAPEACVQAKKGILEGLKAVENMPEEEKAKVKEWLDREDTLVTPGDVEVVLENFKQTYEKAEAKKA